MEDGGCPRPNSSVTPSTRAYDLCEHDWLSNYAELCILRYHLSPIKQPRIATNFSVRTPQAKAHPWTFALPSRSFPTWIV